MFIAGEKQRVRVISQTPVRKYKRLNIWTNWIIADAHECVKKSNVGNICDSWATFCLLFTLN